jgi:hypothetical protein
MRIQVAKLAACSFALAVTLSPVGAHAASARPVKSAAQTGKPGWLKRFALRAEARKELDHWVGEGPEKKWDLYVNRLKAHGGKFSRGLGLMAGTFGGLTGYSGIQSGDHVQMIAGAAFLGLGAVYAFLVATHDNDQARGDVIRRAPEIGVEPPEELVRKMRDARGFGL